ncbi:MAG: acetylxylan esterase, partial [Chloroflexi bacterium]|nr:acetylxylan esterase [Chloroflexota bacterium]
MELSRIEQLYQVILGPFPERVPLNLEVLAQEECDHFTRMLIAWDNDASERVRGYLLQPRQINKKLPALLAFHGHIRWDLGKKHEADVDVQENAHLPLGPELARRGFVVLCGDAICWGDRQNPAEEPGGVMYERMVAMRLLAEGRCMASQYVWDAMRQCDVLQSLDLVDGQRIGAIGISMGSGHAWLSAMIEKRIRALVGVSSFYTYKALYQPPIIHCYMNYLPNVLKYGIETYDLFQLIAPRPFLMINGKTEPQDPVEATRELYEKAIPAWEALGAGDDFRLFFHEGGLGAMSWN